MEFANKRSPKVTYWRSRVWLESWALKKTPELIPLCHGIPLEQCSVDLTVQDDRIHVQARCELVAKTGIEMEALTAVSIACLTLYDMCKAIDKAMRIEGIRLLSKTGGKSGNYYAEG